MITDRCVLTGVWFSTCLNIDDIVHVQSSMIEDNMIVVNNQIGFVVVNPDQMVTGTAISRSVFCLRSSWLAEMFKGWAGSNIQMIVGNLVHELFQFGCMKKTNDRQVYLDQLDRLMSSESLMFDCFSNRISQDEVREAAISYVDNVIKWVQTYMLTSSPQPISSTGSDAGQKRMRVLRVLDVEDNIWTPRYGIKGKVDLTLEVEIHERNQRTRKTVPLELKTGRHVHSFEHQGQVSLYTMMLEGKQQNCDSGLLLYLKEGVDMRLVAANQHVKKSLIQMRNELAHFLSKVSITPDHKNAYRLCNRCSHVFDCTLMAEAFDKERVANWDELRDKLMPEQLGHLGKEDFAFFRCWVELIHLEDNHDRQKMSDSGRPAYFWDETSEQRESLGLGLAKLRLLAPATVDESSLTQEAEAIKDDDSITTNLCFTFVRASEYEKTLGQLPFEQSAIRVLERVSLTIENADEELIKIANVTGYVRHFGSDRIEILCSKSIRPSLQSKLFRVDILNSSYSSSGIFYTNILQLMMNETNCDRLRRLLIARMPGRFKMKLDKELIGRVRPYVEHLNPEQQRAVLRAILSEDYLLIQAGPGSGKTETIVAMIRVLNSMNKRVLITSHTHSAIDNIAVKLFDCGIKFLRLGSRSRINSKIERCSESSQLPNIRTAGDLHSFYDQQMVVVATCLSVASHPLFTDRRFDFCIVDEASQVLLPEVLGPLLVCDRFVLVGDSNQLPPVVRSVEAIDRGFNQGLLEWLDNDGESCWRLRLQYRMNREIMRLANACMYQDSLSCANESVANAVLTPVNEHTVTTSSMPEWLQKCVNVRLEHSVVFLNTENNSDAEHRKDDQNLLYNYYEAALVRQIVHTLIDRFGLESQQIGVVTPYQRQVRMLRSTLSDQHPGIEINTVDQFQGRDKQVIIISCVRSDSSQQAVRGNEILSDERRLNVAITRAKHKLILIGNRKTLTLYEPFVKLFNALRPDQIFMLDHHDSPDIQLH